MAGPSSWIGAGEGGRYALKKPRTMPSAAWRGVSLRAVTVAAARRPVNPETSAGLSGRVYANVIGRTRTT